MKHSILLLIFYLLIANSTTATESFVVVMKSNVVHTFNIADIQKLTFPLSSLKVHTKKSGEFNFLNTDIRYFNFSNQQTQTGIMIPTGEQKFNLKLFPNPSSDRLHIDFLDSEGTIEITLFNSMGAIVMVKTVSDKKEGIDIRQLSNGFYVCKVSSGTKSAVATFVKN